MERERQYEEYKRAKLKRQKEASDAAKNLHMKNYNEVSSKLLPPSHGRPPLGNNNVDSLARVKKTRFQLSDDAKNRIRRSQAEEFSDDEYEDEVGDLYLYRQPELNKVLWETKPRPYL